MLASLKIEGFPDELEKLMEPKERSPRTTIVPLSHSYRDPAPLYLDEEERVEPWFNPRTNRWTEEPYLSQELIDYHLETLSLRAGADPKHHVVRARRDEESVGLRVKVVYRGALSAERVASIVGLSTRRELLELCERQIAECVEEIDSTLGILR